MRLAVAALFVMLAMTGCANKPGPDQDEAAVQSFPEDYEIPGAEPLSRNGTSATFRWTGTATVGATVGYGGRHTLGADAALDLPVPPGLDLLLQVSLQYPFTTFEDLAISVTDAKGTERCLAATDQPSAGGYVAQCTTSVTAKPASETWRITALTEVNHDPGTQFQVDITWTLFGNGRFPVQPTDAPIRPEPHVVVAVLDSGVNPYHAAYHRPERTMHPCTYIEGYPCDIPALPLTLGVHAEWDIAVEADRPVWENVTPGQWYWIPGTALVAVSCTPATDNSPVDELVQGLATTLPTRCILDTDGHGTGTTSAILQQNPDALIVSAQQWGVIGPEDMGAIKDAPFPIDLDSFSHGSAVPGAETRGDCRALMDLFVTPSRLFVASGGNSPGSTALSCDKGDPRIITVGGAYAADRTQDRNAAWTTEVVGPYCRPVARHDDVAATMRSLCGTSFAAPTVAGALSRVILELRRESQFTGTTLDGVIDPVLEVTIHDLRDAMNLTASYAPTAQFNETGDGIPLNPLAPWMQWGWGFYDSTVTDATVAHLLGTAPATKPMGAVQWMEAQHAVKKQLWGS